MSSKQNSLSANISAQSNALTLSCINQLEKYQ
jgi:hypothetical protein